MSESVEEKIRLILKSLPSEPGVYRFYDEAGNLLYVGKAKNLKNRVNSYFSRQTYDSARIKLLVRLTCDIHVLVVNSELDALLLENNLIKEHQPRFNVLLRDDKTYPWICIRNEDFPRIHPTRTRVNDGSEYFGPYASVKMMRNLLELLKQLYPLRTCKLNLKPESIAAGKFSQCLEFHLGNCMAPCEGKQSEASYMMMVKEAREIIRGKTASLLRSLRSEMQVKAEAYEFEQAQRIKERIETLEQYRARSVISSSDIGDVDVFCWHQDNKLWFITYLQVVEGAVVQGHTLEIKSNAIETAKDILAVGIFELRRKFSSEAREALIPELLPELLPNLNYVVPQRGDKKVLVELAQKNMRFYLMERWKKLAVKDPEQHTERLMTLMQKELRLPRLPHHIECFDNSNFQGAFPVSAMVLFRDGKPSKKEYRHYNIRTVEGPNDFASMEEALDRRYGRLLEEQSPLPDLVIVDGGKGQLSAAVNTLEKLGLRGKVPVIGIAKRLEEIYFPGDSLPLYIDKRSETLKVIQHMRNEAHRFGISHYRKRHQKTLSHSTLEEIPGIGKKIAEKLLKTFKSVKRIRESDLEALEKEVGKVKAASIYNYFHG
jgi:excinuclease ABC subunit C